jgi:MFS superfamily sulfate permease-like transporter
MVALFSSVLNMIPISALAAVLVYTGYKLVNVKVIKDLARFGASEVFIYFATMLTIVATDLLIGVTTGIVLAALKLLYTFSHLDIRMESDPQKRRSTLYLNGTATFLRLPKLAAALEQVPANHELHVQFERLDYIDHACLDLLINWEKQHQATGGSLVIDWDSLTAKFKGRANGNGNGNGHGDLAALTETAKENGAQTRAIQKRERQHTLTAATQEGR